MCFFNTDVLSSDPCAAGHSYQMTTLTGLGTKAPQLHMGLGLCLTTLLAVQLVILICKVGIDP